jgi:hypothetical protein
MVLFENSQNDKAASIAPPVPENIPIAAPEPATDPIARRFPRNDVRAILTATVTPAEGESTRITDSVSPLLMLLENVQSVICGTRVSGLLTTRTRVPSERHPLSH